MPLGLTPRQRELLAYLSERETPPSFDEMRCAIGVKHKSSVFHLLNGLEERGYVRRHKRRVRAIEVLRPLPSNQPSILATIDGEKVPLRFLTLDQAKQQSPTIEGGG